MNGMDGEDDRGRQREGEWVGTCLYSPDQVHVFSRVPLRLIVLSLHSVPLPVSQQSWPPLMFVFGCQCH